MANWIAGGIGHEVLLRDIGDIFGFRVFREEMIERLILARPDLLGNCLPPCLGIREDRVHVVDYPPEGKFPVLSLPKTSIQLRPLDWQSPANQGMIVA